MKHYKDAQNNIFGFEENDVLPKGLTEVTMAEIKQINLGKRTPEQIANQLTQKALSEFTTSIATLTENAPKGESDSWMKQELEARNLSNPTPLIDGLIISRGLGETREALASKIIANSDAYAMAYAVALGEYQAKIKGLK